MRNAIPKALVAGVTALSLAASVFGATPAAADGRGWHGHYGHWHGYNGRWHSGSGWLGPAIIGGLAAGALLAAPHYGYGGSCYAYAPTYDAYGDYIGQQPVNVC